MKPNGRVLIFSIFFLFIVFSASAFSISPMSTSITPTAPGNLATFKVENESTSPIAVVIRIVTRSLDQNGVEKNEAITKDFVVFPARVVIQPNSSQNVKVQWKGPSTLPAELSFRVIAEQVPVDFTRDQTSGVKVLFRYLASLYVSPAGIIAKPVLENVTGGVANGTPGLLVRLRNDGTRHGLLFTTVLRIKLPGQNQQLEFSGKLMESIEGMNLLAKTSRIFFVPWNQAVAGTVYEGTFSASIE
jgi:fimbrial chaperone protein